jgi:hypothetical protein
MNSTIQLILTILGAVFVLLSAYGAVKRDRKLFLSGFCFFSFIPIIGESIAYNANQAPIHIMVIIIFLAQLILQIPDKIIYGRDNAAATQIATKVGLAILIFNIGAAIYIFCLNAGVPVQFGYYHVAFSLIIIYIMFKRFSSNVSWAK